MLFVLRCLIRQDKANNNTMRGGCPAFFMPFGLRLNKAEKTNAKHLKNDDLAGFLFRVCTFLTYIKSTLKSRFFALCVKSRILPKAQQKQSPFVSVVNRACFAFFCFGIYKDTTKQKNTVKSRFFVAFFAPLKKK